MPQNYLIEVKLARGDLTPKQISARVLGELLDALEQMLAPVVVRDNRALGLEESDIIIGLAAVRQGSYVLEFETQYESEIARAYQLASNAVVTENFAALPAKSVEAIKIIRKLTRKLNTEIQFWEHNGGYRQLATVSQNTRIETSDSLLAGTTTLYGTVLRVGGIDPPRVTLRLLDQSEFTCRITKQAEYAVARELGRKLYDVVGVRGTAFWNTEMTMVDFLVDEVTPYASKDISEALDTLHKLIGKYYQHIADVDAFVSEIRGDGEEV